MTRVHPFRGLSAAVSLIMRPMPTATPRPIVLATVRPGPGSIVAVEHAHEAQRLDAVAGSEFVDDRLRSLE